MVNVVKIIIKGDFDMVNVVKITDNATAYSKLKKFSIPHFVNGSMNITVIVSENAGFFRNKCKFEVFGVVTDREYEEDVPQEVQTIIGSYCYNFKEKILQKNTAQNMALMVEALIDEKWYDSLVNELGNEICDWYDKNMR